MWLLSSKGSALNDKSIWLTPNSHYIIGRKVGDTSPGVTAVKVTPQWVSRRHMEIIVHPLDHPMDHSKIPRVELVDLKTKFGFMLGDVAHIKDGDRVADLMALRAVEDSTAQNHHNDLTIKHEMETVIRLGGRDIDEVTFSLKWVPFVVSYSVDEHSLSVTSTDLQKAHHTLESLGIPVSRAISSSTKFYVLEPYKDTVKSLFALINGIPVVTPKFLVDVFMPKCLNIMNTTDYNQGIKFAYEEAAKYAAAPGLNVDPRRKTCLQNFVLVSFHPSQYEALSSLIEAASGLCILCDLTSPPPQKTLDTADQVKSYVKEHINTYGGKSLVLLKYPLQSDSSEKAVQRLKLANDAARLLEVRSVDISEVAKAVKAIQTDILVPIRSVSKSDSNSFSNTAAAPAVKPGRSIVKRRLPKAVNFLDALANTNSQTQPKAQDKDHDQIQLPPLKKAKVDAPDSQPSQLSTTASLSPSLISQDLDDVLIERPVSLHMDPLRTHERAASIPNEADEVRSPSPELEPVSEESSPEPSLHVKTSKTQKRTPKPTALPEEPLEEPEEAPDPSDDVVTEETVNQIRKLTVIDNSLVLTRKSLHTNSMTRLVNNGPNSRGKDPQWKDRPNYKAFSKHGRSSSNIPGNKPGSNRENLVTVTLASGFRSRQDKDLSDMLENHLKRQRRPSEPHSKSRKSKRRKLGGRHDDDYSEESSLSESVTSAGKVTTTDDSNTSKSIFDLEFGKDSVNATNGMTSGIGVYDFDDRDDDEHIFRFSN